MELYGLLGEKLGHSLSPKIHNYILNYFKIHGNYSIVEIERKNLRTIIPNLKELGYRGINVTLPYKEIIIPYLDEISYEATSIGSINTISFQNDLVIGYNTDYYGFESMLKKENVHVKNKNITVLGTGGSTKTIICYLKDNEAKSINILYRNENKASLLKQTFPFINLISLKSKEYISGDICINATPVGMSPNINDCLLDENIIKKFTVCIDIIYNPIKTKFLQIADKNNIKAINGLYMLIYQAIKSQEIFQGASIHQDMADEIYQLLKD